MADAAQETKKMDIDLDEKEDKKDDDLKEDKKEMDIDIDDEEEEEEKIHDASPTAEIEEKVNIIIAESESSSSLSSGIEKLLYLEKKQRQSENEANTLFIAKCILNLCKKSGDFDITVEQIAILSRRRSQFRRVIMRLVQYAMSWLDDDDDILQNDKDKKLKLINTLILVTEGKIFVEVERARLTRKLAQIQEKEDKNISLACDTLQELQIETFGSMRKKEKCDFLLEQFRLNLAKKDFIRAGIVRNKISKKILKKLYDLECKYWNLSLILFYHHDQQFLELSKAYFRLKELLKEKKDKLQALKNGIFALILSKYDTEQNDLLFRILSTEKKLLEQLPIFRQLLTLLTTSELIEWPLNEEMMNEINIFKFIGVVDDKQNDLMLKLKNCIIQHNIRVVAKYYNRISIKRLSTFLSIDINQTEKYVSKMVTDKEIFARINRLDAIITFKKKEYQNQILNDWKSDTDKLLHLVDLTCHQIHKEMVIHKTKSKKSKK